MTAQPPSVHATHCYTCTHCRHGYDKYSFNRAGFGKDSYDIAGYDKAGYDKNGYSRDGFSKCVTHVVVQTECAVSGLSARVSSCSLLLLVLDVWQ